MNNTSKVLLGVLAGAAAGAVLGILLAPDKGSETRKKIMKAGEDYANNFKDKIDEVIDGVSERFGSVKEDAKNAINNGKAKMEQYKSEANNI